MWCCSLKFSNQFEDKRTFRFCWKRQLGNLFEEEVVTSQVPKEGHVGLHVGAEAVDELIAKFGEGGHVLDARRNSRAFRSSAEHHYDRVETSPRKAVKSFLRN